MRDASRACELVIAMMIFFKCATLLSQGGHLVGLEARAGSVLGPAPAVSVQLTPNWLPSDGSIMMMMVAQGITKMTFLALTLLHH